MAVYRCEQCDSFVDDDYNPGTEYGDGLICEACFCEILNEVEKYFPKESQNMTDEEKLKWHKRNA